MKILRRKRGDVACCGTITIQSFPFGPRSMTNRKYVSPRLMPSDYKLKFNERDITVLQQRSGWFGGSYMLCRVAM